MLCDYRESIVYYSCFFVKFLVLECPYSHCVKIVHFRVSRNSIMSTIVHYAVVLRTVVITLQIKHFWFHSDNFVVIIIFLYIFLFLRTHHFVDYFDMLFNKLIFSLRCLLTGFDILGVLG